MSGSNNVTLKRILGNFIQDLPPSQEYLILSFSSSSVPLRQRWRNNYLSADFLADYLSTFFLSSDERLPDIEKQAEVKSAVGYIANELLENAMKYCVSSSSPISIQIHLNSELVILQLTNSITLERAYQFQNWIETILKYDPHELYIAQIEKNALEKDGEFKLGLLTMINDYGAKLGWQFERLSYRHGEIVVTTMVQLTI